MSILARFSALTNAFGQGTDNTNRVLDNQFLTPAYAASLSIAPTKANTLVQVGLLTGAMTVNLGVGSATTAPFVGDKAKLLFTSTAGATVTLGTGILGASATIIIPAAKTANISLMFNGAAWVEESRVITA